MDQSYPASVPNEQVDLLFIKKRMLIDLKKHRLDNQW